MFFKYGIVLLILLISHTLSKHHHGHRHFAFKKHKLCSPAAILRSCAAKKQKVCSEAVLCKGVEAIGKLLTSQTENMAAQGKALAARLDAGEAKIIELESVGKKMTEIVTSSQKKLAAQGDKLQAQTSTLTDQLKAQAEKISSRMTDEDTKLTAIEGQNKKMTTDLETQNTKITTIQQTGVKVLDTVGVQEKALMDKLQGQFKTLSTSVGIPEGKLEGLKDTMGKLSEIINGHDEKMGTVKAGSVGLKDKLKETETKLADVELAQTEVGGGLAAAEETLNAGAQGLTIMTETLGNVDTKMGEVEGVAGTMSESLKAADLRLGSVEAGIKSNSAKLAANAGKVLELASMATVAQTALKGHAASLEKIKAKPPPLPALPGK